jgi:hypothetical protein
MSAAWHDLPGILRQLSGLYASVATAVSTFNKKHCLLYDGVWEEFWITLRAYLTRLWCHNIPIRAITCQGGWMELLQLERGIVKYSWWNFSAFCTTKMKVPVVSRRYTQFWFHVRTRHIFCPPPHPTPPHPQSLYHFCLVKISREKRVVRDRTADKHIQKSRLAKLQLTLVSQTFILT